MSGRNGFPWGGHDLPSPRLRLVVAIIIASASAVLHFIRAIGNRGQSDFTPLWHAARTMFDGGNPYTLIGPHLTIPSPYPMYYPATTFVSVAPLSLIPSYHLASTVFVAVSVFLLAYGITRDGWHMLPIFPSIAFLTSVTLAQWSILFTAAVYLPSLCFLAMAKPQNALPVIVSSFKANAMVSAAIGSLILIATSLLLMPSWPSMWLAQLGSSADFVPPVLRFAGPLILVALVKWRRPESWLVAISACLPQTWPPYNGLILLTVARTYRQACLLSLVSSFSWILFAWFADGLSPEEAQHSMSIVLNLAGYLPAAFLILLRPNVGPSPVWLALRRKQRGG